MLEQARPVSTRDHAPTFALALAAAALLALGGVGGYEVGTMVVIGHPSTAHPVTQAQDAPPAIGLQP